MIFSFDPSFSTYTKLHEFDIAGGANPYGSIMQASDGKLYGMTSRGGSAYDGSENHENEGTGVIFSFTPTSSIYTIEKDFAINDGGNDILDELVLASDGKLYGMTFGGGMYGKGVIFLSIL